MNKLALLAGAAFLSMGGVAHAQGVGPPIGVLCGNVTVLTNPAAGHNRMVTGIAGKTIALCGYTVSGTTTGTIQLEQGSGGTTCGTGNVVLSPVISFTANQTVMALTDYADVSIPAGLDLCANTSGTTNFSLAVYWSQF